MMETIDLDSKKRLIKKQAVFSKLTDKEINELVTLWTEEKVLAGTTIVTEGEPIDSVYLIINGKAEVRRVTIQNHEPQIEPLATLGPEDAIGLNETGFYSISGVRTANVVALTEMNLLRLSMAAFHGFALVYPHVNEVMRKNAKEYLGDNFNKIE